MSPFNNSQIQSFFTTGTYSQAPTNASNHSAAVAGFFGWMSKADPQMYAKIIATRPDLTQGADVVDSGKMVAKRPALAGMGVYDDGYGGESFSAGEQVYQPATNWGTELLDTINKLLPTYFNAQATQNAIDLQQQQNQALLLYNMRRAEQGLQPVNNIRDGGSMSGTTILAIAAVAFLALRK